VNHVSVGAFAVQTSHARELIKLRVVDGCQVRTSTDRPNSLVRGRVQNLQRLGDAAKQWLQDVGSCSRSKLHRKTPEIVSLLQRLGIEDTSAEVGDTHTSEAVGCARVAAHGQESVVNGVESETVGHSGYEPVVIGRSTVPCHLSVSFVDRWDRRIKRTVFGDALGAGAVDQSILRTRIAEECLQGLFVQDTFLGVWASVVGHEAVNERVSRWEYSESGEWLDSYQ
jgi:hypothetical protein